MKRGWGAAALALLALLAGVVATLWWSQRIPGFDALRLFSPYYTLLADFAAAGRLLLWEPWSNCGSPAHAYVEMGSYSPLTLLHASATGGGHPGFELYWLAIWAIGGLGMLALARGLDAPVWAGLAVAISFAFSGFWLGHATHTSWLYAHAFLPWMLWRVDAALAQRRLWPCVEAGALYGLSALAGHPALVVGNGLFVAGWVAARLASAPRAEPRALLRAALALATLVGVGAVVLSPAYVSFLVDAAGYADRVGALERAVAVSDHALPPGALAALASPYLPLLPLVDPAFWSGTWAGLTASYLGPLVPALALLALGAGPERRFAVAIALLGLLNLAWALGDVLPLRGWLYDALPPTRYFRHTAVFRAWFAMALCVLALLGARVLARSGAGGEAWRRLAWIASALALPMGLAFGAALAAASTLAPGLALAKGELLLAWLGTPLLCHARASALRERRRAATPLLAGLVALVAVDAALAVAVSSPLMTISTAGYAVDASRRNRSLELGERGLGRDPAPARSLGNRHLPAKIPTLESFNTLNSRYHTSRGVGSASWQNLPESWADVPVLRRAVSGDPDRIWFAEEALALARSPAAFAAYAARARQLGAPPIVVHPRDAMLAGDPDAEASDDAALAAIAELPAARRVAVDVTAYDPDRLAFAVELPAPGWLLVTDRWARGWRARVDGEPAEIWGGSFLFRALPIAAGRHRVEFDYAPTLHPWLVAASWGTLGLVALVSPWRARR